jgi:hypothetical protein
MRFIIWAKSWFSRLQIFLHRELLIFRFRARSFFLLRSQAPWHSSIKTSAGSVEIIIPFPAQGRVTPQKHDYYLRSLRKLITTHLPQQTYTNYRAIIYCDPLYSVEKLPELFKKIRLERK